MTVYFGKTYDKQKITFFYRDGYVWSVHYVSVKNPSLVRKRDSYTTMIDIYTSGYIPVEIPDDTILDDIPKYMPVELLL